MTTFELATKYYPRLWNRARIDSLLEAGKLTPEEYNNIVQKGVNSNGFITNQ